MRHFNYARLFSLLFPSYRSVTEARILEEEGDLGKVRDLVFWLPSRSSTLSCSGQIFSSIMHSTYSHILLPILLSLASRAVIAQQIAAPNYDQGWCYYCSDDDAPALCNAQCTIAINSLCGQDLTQSQLVTEQNCTLQYKPPVNPNFNQNGNTPPSPTESQCSITFNNILASCGRDAGSPNSATVNASYCTTSGGGGTYGWNDDGSVMTNGLGRYIVSTTGTDQCGQAEASWQQATSVILWNDSWIGPNDQVVLDTNPPPLTGTAAALATAIPTPNPECDTEVCDIYDNPYYATSPVGPWPEGGKNSLRHRIVYEGWSEAPNSQRLPNSIEDRCGVSGGNYQAYMNGTQNVADFDLPSDLCWCIPDAIFDASVGIQLPDDTFCPAGTTLQPGQEVNRIELRRLMERGLKMRDPTRTVERDESREVKHLRGRHW